MDCPVVIFVFNRPHVVDKLLTALAEVRPKTIFVVSDGPRLDRPDEASKVAECRWLFEVCISWPCEIRTNYSESNMGCRTRVVSGLNWVFSQVDRAIILEDDCIPSPTFFPFCQELLERYAVDSRIMSISGSNHVPERMAPRTESYYFARYHHCWGWATWARAWRHYDDSFLCWEKVRNTPLLRELLGSWRASIYWRRIFDLVHSGRINSWAYRWQLCCWLQSGYSIIPKVNLISNEGTGDDALHTRRYSFAHAKRGEIAFPLIHPAHCIRTEQHDRYIEDHIFSKSLFNRVRWLLEKSWSLICGNR